ncbi:MAG: FG-GAP repeat protein, partial [Ferruginibacter sp.]
MKKKILLLFGSLVVLFSQAQNVGIGTETPNASAQLELQSANKGMLVPRVALTAANIAAPVTAPANALLLYNTATSGTGENAVKPGFYYWNSVTSRWVAIATEAGVSPNGSVGFGTWGDCSINNVSEYNPAVAADGESQDLFGFSVSMSGNYAVIGAYGDDGQKGAAYIFFYNGSGWVQQQKLTANDGTAADFFGYKVFIMGNYAFIGAPGDNSSMGSAYVFFFNGITWTQQQKLTASDGAGGDNFGGSVGISGSDAIIGAPGDDVFKGSAYIFHFNAGTWQQLPKLTANDGVANDFFGFSVSVSGNYALVGADHTNTQQGS